MSILPKAAKLSLAGLMMALASLSLSLPARAETATPPLPVMPDISWLIMSQRVNTSYQIHTAPAGGTWYSYATVADTAGLLKPAVEVRADTPVWAYSVNKLSVAVAVMDKVDRGEGGEVHQ